MNREPSVCPISSTPHPKRNPLLSNLFENDTLSPIQILQPDNCTKPIQKRAKSVRTATRVHAAIPNKRRCGVKDKVAESASSAVLVELGVTAESLRKNALSQSRNLYNMYPEPVAESASSAVLVELGVTAESLRKNALSQSRNLYNMYPEPVVLESDEEEELLETRTSHKKSPEKKERRVNKTSAIKQVENTVNDGENPDVDKKTDEEDEANLQLRPGRKKSPEKKERRVNKTSVRAKKVNNNEKDGEESDEYSKPERSRVKKPGQSGVTSRPQPASALIKTAASKQPSLENLVNIKATETAVKRKKKILTKPAADLQEKSCATGFDNDDSLFPQYNFNKNVSKSMKRFHNNTPSVRNSIDMDAIKWTPRVAKSVKSKASSWESAKDCGDEGSYNHKKLENENVDTTKSICIEKPCTRQPDKENISSDENCQLINNNSHPTQGFPKECLSRFEDVVFRHNKGSGGIVANSLQTDTLNLGYVEVKKGEVFSVQRPRCTLVLIEGQVEVKRPGATETLSLGDMLHIPTDSLHQFHNTGTQNARLIYIKENH